MNSELLYITAVSISLIAIAGGALVAITAFVLGIVSIGRPQAKQPDLRSFYSLALGLTAVALLAAIIAAVVASG